LHLIFAPLNYEMIEYEWYKEVKDKIAVVAGFDVENFDIKRLD